MGSAVFNVGGELADSGEVAGGWIKKSGVGLDLRVDFHFIDQAQAGFTLSRTEFSVLCRTCQQQGGGSLVAGTGQAQHDQGGNEKRGGVHDFPFRGVREMALLRQNQFVVLGDA